MIEKKTAANGRVYYMRSGDSGSGYASKADYDAYVAGRKSSKGKGKGRSTTARRAPEPAPAPAPRRRAASSSPRESTAARYDDLFDALIRR